MPAPSYAHRAEQRALLISDVMCRVRPELAHLYADGCNMSPWFSAPCLFESAAERVFLAVNPGGDPDHGPRPYRPREHDCAKERCADGRFNRWLDEKWGRPAGRAKNQVAVRKAFEALYGDDAGVQALRDTPSFEVCPLRTHIADDIPAAVWDASVEWCQDVLEHLRPKLVISNGNREGSRSAWSAVQQMYGFERLGKHDLPGSATLKWGPVAGGPLDCAIVLGIPHLSRWGTRHLYNALRDLRSDFGID